MEQIKLIKNENSIYELSPKTPLYSPSLNLFFSLFVYDCTDMNRLYSWLKNDEGRKTFCGNLCILQKIDGKETNKKIPTVDPNEEYTFLRAQEEFSEYNKDHWFMMITRNFVKTIEQWIKIKQQMPNEVTVKMGKSEVFVE